MAFLPPRRFFRSRYLFLSLGHLLDFPQLSADFRKDTNSGQLGADTRNGQKQINLGLELRGKVVNQGFKRDFHAVDVVLSLSTAVVM
jgi:hypothetical protein